MHAFEAARQPSVSASLLKLYRVLSDLKGGLHADEKTKHGKDYMV